MLNHLHLLPFSKGKQHINAGVAKLVDVSDLGSDAVRHGGSSPFTRTIEQKNKEQGIKNFEGMPFIHHSTFLVPCSLFKSFFLALPPNSYLSWLPLHNRKFLLCTNI